MTKTLGQVQQAIGTALATISGLRVYAFPPLSAQPPFAFVDMPESPMEYDLTFQRGSDRMLIPVYVALGNQVDRNIAAAVSSYQDATVVKAAIEAITAFPCRVQSMVYGTVNLAGVTYPGVLFQVDCIA